MSGWGVDAILRRLMPLDEESLLAAARRKAQADDFGDESFHEPLRRLLLEAPPAQITLSTDLTDATLSVDGASATQIQGGETEVPPLPPGAHKLEIQSTGAKATLQLNFTSGALPTLTEKIQAQGINAVVVSRFSSQAMVYSNTEGALVAAFGINAAWPAIGPSAFITAVLVGLVPIARRAVMAAMARIPFSIEMLMTVAAVGAVIIGAGEEAATVVFLFLVGELLEGVAAGKARSSIQALTKLVPKTALIEENGKTREVPAESLAVGAICAAG
jgi:cation transport ATPase